MMLEIAGMRILSPYFGSSFIVSTSTIGIILASLSLGYFIGGNISDNSPSMKKLSLFVLVAGVYNLFTSFFQFKVFEYISQSMNLNIFFSSIIAAIFLFTVPSILLGAVSPYVVKVALASQVDNNNTGHIVGKLYALSTIGSILGTFICGFWLILYFGLEIISLLVSFSIFLCALFCHLSEANNVKDKKNNSLFLFLILSAICINFFFIVFFKLNKFKISENSIFSTTTPYQYLTVNKNKDESGEFLILQNAVDKRGPCFSILPLYGSHVDTLFLYHKFFYDVFCEKKQKENVLLLGNGAGIFLSAVNIYKEEQNLKDISIDVVEIDEATTKIAKIFFDMKVDSTTIFYHEDARTFLNKKIKTKEKLYDLIFLDVYKEGLFIPQNLITFECLSNIKSLLKDDGMLLINVVGSRIDEPYKSYLNQVYTQVSSVFENTFTYHLGEQVQMKNFVIVGCKDLNDKNLYQIIEKRSSREYKNLENTGEIYTDKFAPLEKLLLKK